MKPRPQVKMNKFFLYFLPITLLIIGAVFYYLYVSNSPVENNSIPNNIDNQTATNGESAFFGTVVMQISNKTMNGNPAVQFKIRVSSQPHVFQNTGSASGDVIVSIDVSNPAHLLKSNQTGIFHTTYDVKNKWYVLKSFKDVIFDF